MIRSGTKAKSHLTWMILRTMDCQTRLCITRVGTGLMLQSRSTVSYSVGGQAKIQVSGGGGSQAKFEARFSLHTSYRLLSINSGYLLLGKRHDSGFKGCKRAYVGVMSLPVTAQLATLDYCLA